MAQFMFKDVTIYQINILFKICENLSNKSIFVLFYNLKMLLNGNSGCRHGSIFFFAKTNTQ